MRITTQLSIAAALAVTSFGASPSIATAMECSQLCRDFLPQPSLTSSGDDYDCQDIIDDSGGSCTINGKRNVFMELPRDIELDGFNMPIKRGGKVVDRAPNRNTIFSDDIRVR